MQTNLPICSYGHVISFCLSIKDESTSASSSGSQTIDNHFSKELRGDYQGKRKESLSFFFFPINVKVDGLRHIIWEGILDLNLGRLPQECLFLLLTWSMQRTWGPWGRFSRHSMIQMPTSLYFHIWCLSISCHDTPEPKFPTAWLSLRPDTEELKEAWVQGQLEIITYNQRTHRKAAGTAGWGVLPDWIIRGIWTEATGLKY